jgi:hypothetical protein
MNVIFAIRTDRLRQAARLIRPAGLSGFSWGQAFSHDGGRKQYEVAISLGVAVQGRGCKIILRLRDVRGVHMLLAKMRWEGGNVTCFVIRTQDDDDIGFLLFAGHEGDWPPSGRIDCVFTGFPHDSTLGDDPHGRFVLAHKHMEWVAEVSYTEEEMTVIVDLSTGWTFELKSNEVGNNWRARHGDESICGTGEFL